MIKCEKCGHWHGNSQVAHSGPRNERKEIFKVVGNELVRDVSPRSGEPYIHYCTIETFREVCHGIDEWGAGEETELAKSFVMTDLVGVTGRPSTQVATALAFLKETNVVAPLNRYRRSIANSDDVFLDGMVEWMSLEFGNGITLVKWIKDE